MPMIQIRNVPEEIHRTLEARAAQAGMSLSDFLLQEMTAIAARPSLADVLERIQRRGPPPRKIDSVRAVRAEREGQR